GEPVPFAAWMRTVVVLGMTATLFYFFWRATKGFYWGYQRLRLFTQIFPVITLVMAAIPGLYPVWMITEQIVFSLVMIGVGDFLTRDHVRELFRRPESRPRPSSDVLPPPPPRWPHPTTRRRASSGWAAMRASLSSSAPSAPRARPSMTLHRPATITRSAFSAPQRTRAGIGSCEPETDSPSRRNIARSACLPTSLAPMSSRPTAAAEPVVAQSRIRSQVTMSVP